MSNFKKEMGMSKTQFIFEFIGLAILMSIIFFMPVWFPVVMEVIQ